MMKELLFIVVLFISIPILGQSNEKSFLVVDPLGHNAIVNNLEYSSLTDELISVSNDKTVRFWNLAEENLSRTFRLPNEVNGPEGMLYASAISPDGRLLAVAGYFKENEIRIIDILKGEIVEVLMGHSNVITDLEFDTSGNILTSASSDQTIKIWEKIENTSSGFNLKNELIYQKARINDVDFSMDGSYLVSVSEDESVVLWKRENNNFKFYTQLKNHLGGVKKVAAGKEGFISGDVSGIVNYWRYTGSLEAQIIDFEGSVTAIELNKAKNVCLIAADKQILVNLNNPTANQSILPPNFNVSAALFAKEQLFIAQGREGNILAIDKQLNPVYGLTGNGRSFTGILVNDNRIGFAEKNSKIPLIGFDLKDEKIIRDKSALVGFKPSIISDGLFSFSLIDQGMQLTYGSEFQVKNTSNDGQILCYSLLPDGNVIVGSDRTLKVYDKKGKLIKILSGHNGQVLSLAVMANFIISHGSDQQTKFWNLNTYELSLQLFITKDFQWILWRPDGTYAASAGGERYLGWQTNKSKNELAEFVDISTYAKQFQRANLANEEPVNSELPRDIEEIKLPPTPQVIWTSPTEYQVETTEPNFRLTAEIYSDQPIEKVKILVQGKATPEKRGVTEKRVVDEIIPINSYRTIVQIFAKTADNKITSEKRVIINPNLEGKAGNAMEVIDPDEKPDLYFVGIGVSEFKNTSFNLTFADDDATSIHNIFLSKNSPYFDEFHGNLILNNEATKEGMLAALNDLVSKVKPKDQVVLFIASHGLNEKGLYYVLTHDADENNLKQTCLSWSDLSEILAQLPCKVILFLDTCHSGALGANLMANSPKNTEALRQMGSSEVGVIIMSGSTGDESSLESEEWAHGAFTLSLIEGIEKKKADIKADGIIDIRELDLFVANMVYELTSGKQNPTTQKPSTISKFIVY